MISQLQVAESDNVAGLRIDDTTNGTGFNRAAIELP